MKTVLIALFTLSTLIIWGCEVDIFQPDLTPPSAPRGLYTETGDNLVELFWYSNPEGDVRGYNIYVSSSYNGSYELIATTRDPHLMDYGARNGRTYYYAVAAFDEADNESELSRDVAYDTPRPEGYDVGLRNFRTNPSASGYDFSTYSVGRHDDEYTDVFFEYYDGTVYLDVWEDSDIQDMGYTESLYDLREAPIGGWSPTRDARVVPGHTYVIWTWDDHYAKLRVTSVSATRVTFDWSYQLQKGNPRVKRAATTDRSALAGGSGVRSRN